MSGSRAGASTAGTAAWPRRTQRPPCAARAPRPGSSSSAPTRARAPGTPRAAGIGTPADLGRVLGRGLGRGLGCVLGVLRLLLLRRQGTEAPVSSWLLSWDY